ncbi:metalloendoproteinase 5-MMP [Populus trichocarpa]|uniref:metalloendoproteinase 5-MMP n=1 Tax=Populus trichocarpa TaxID=3694 RepID=UPI002279620C|nr:metalloendoproteinase 5-MMP [Populus trichocarpa]
MMMPRCGVPDIIDGKTRMHAAGSYNIQYAYFDGAPKWPYTRGYLNWGLQPDIKIGFVNKSSHPGFADGVLGHACPPTDGTMYFNAGQNWSQDAVQGSYDIGTLGLHELGHFLGLNNHSSVEDAIM